MGNSIGAFGTMYMCSSYRTLKECSEEEKKVIEEQTARYRNDVRKHGNYVEVFNQHDLTGYLTRQSGGNWLCYVIVKSQIYDTNPVRYLKFGTKKHEKLIKTLKVHGGITFADGTGKIGFDTGHNPTYDPDKTGCMDTIFNNGKVALNSLIVGTTYKDAEYCIRELKVLMNQIKMLNFKSPKGPKRRQRVHYRRKKNKKRCVKKQR